MSSINLDLKQAFPANQSELAGRRLMAGALSTVTQSLVDANLRIKGGTASALAESQAAAYYVVNSRLATKAAADMAALSGTVTNAAFNVFVFEVQLDGTLGTRMGTEGATLAAVEFPPLMRDRAILGFVIINPTGTGDFVGGTTNLDDGTVVPNAVFVDTPFSFAPKAGVTLVD